MTCAGPDSASVPVTGARRRRLHTAAPAMVLVVLAPIVGEFFLGNLTVDKALILLLFTPLYGGGALLIRETVRRTHRGWPSMILLAAAYALIEEGPVDQLLWNPGYSGGHDALAGDAYLPVPGTNVSIVQAVLSLHVIWSICVPIALVESFFPDRRTVPWLSRAGWSGAALLFGAGVAIGFVGTRAEDPFRATPLQHALSIVVIVGLIVLAFVVPTGLRAVDRRAPRPWLVGVTTLLLTSAMLTLVMFWPTRWSQWISVAAWVLAAGALATGLRYWSRCRGWGDSHRLAAAAGALATYTWIAFPHRPVGGGGPVVDLAGNAVCALAAAALVVGGARRIARAEPPPGPRGAEARGRGRRSAASPPPRAWRWMIPPVVATVTVVVVVFAASVLQHDDLLAQARAEDPAAPHAALVAQLWSRLLFGILLAVSWPLCLQRLARGSTAVYRRCRRVAVAAAIVLLAAAALAAGPSWLRLAHVVLAVCEVGIFAAAMHPAMRAWYATSKRPATRAEDT
ncbi:Uncharacterised protein [Tsukamurella paurometabola]|uniref:DUF998 domain-containing protein n=1 Tax=Tsukamurella paurometabola TaxID=2061 RepID=A0A3P8MBX9_TSUPA|nr:Uncharacterised protein [Tsukamurella paurometabola]